MSITTETYDVVVRKIKTHGGAAFEHGPFALVEVPYGMKVPELKGAPWVRLVYWLSRLLLRQFELGDLGGTVPKKLPANIDRWPPAYGYLYGKLFKNFNDTRRIPKDAAQYFAEEFARAVFHHRHHTTQAQRMKAGRFKWLLPKGHPPAKGSRKAKGGAR